MKKKKSDDRIIVTGRIHEIKGDGKFIAIYKNKNMTEPFMINATCGSRITKDETDSIKVSDMVSMVLSETNLHQGIIIKTPYTK